MRQADLLILHANTLLPMDNHAGKPLTGQAFHSPPVLHNAAIAISGSRILDIGPTNDLLKRVKWDEGTHIIDAKGKTVIPGFVDAHTHLVFAGAREKEFVARCTRDRADVGQTMSGGINTTVRATRDASPDKLKKIALKRLDRMLAHGTTTIEAKSGYGLDTETELKILRVMKTLHGHPIEILPTFLGAHAIPDGWDADDYTRLVIDEMLPIVTSEKLAVFCDVFCEIGFFTPAQTTRILEAAKDLGLGLRLHADELNDLQGAAIAANLGAYSADHLLFVNDDSLRLMAEKGTLAVLLPGTPFFLNLDRYAPAHRMRELGVPIALATDFNPGSSYTESMPIILTLACLKMGFTPLEALAAATINGAYALGVADRVGSLEPGKQADIAILDAPNLDYIPYHFGVNLTETVIKKGKVVLGATRDRA